MQGNDDRNEVVNREKEAMEIADARISRTGGKSIRHRERIGVFGRALDRQPSGDKLHGLVAVAGAEALERPLDYFQRPTIGIGERDERTLDYGDGRGERFGEKDKGRIGCGTNGDFLIDVIGGGG